VGGLSVQGAVLAEVHNHGNRRIALVLLRGVDRLRAHAAEEGGSRVETGEPGEGGTSLPLPATRKHRRF